MITARPLTAEQQHLVLFAFRHPRGRYTTERAGQLSGVPARTLYDWAKEGVLAPDYPGRPMAWSYRDLAGQKNTPQRGDGPTRLSRSARFVPTGPSSCWAGRPSTG